MGPHTPERRAICFAHPGVWCSCPSAPSAPSAGSARAQDIADPNEHPTHHPPASRSWSHTLHHGYLVPAVVASAPPLLALWPSFGCTLGPLKPKCPCSRHSPTQNLPAASHILHIKPKSPPGSPLLSLPGSFCYRLTGLLWFQNIPSTSLPQGLCPCCVLCSRWCSVSASLTLYPTKVPAPSSVLAGRHPERPPCLCPSPSLTFSSLTAPATTCHVHCIYMQSSLSSWNGTLGGCILLITMSPGHQVMLCTTVLVEVDRMSPALVALRVCAQPAALPPEAPVSSTCNSPLPCQVLHGYELSPAVRKVSLREVRS